MKPTVLVVDDDELIRNMLQDLLMDDYTVVLAPDGHEALGLMLCEQLSVDLIITDFDMPGLNGVELIETISDDTPFIFITGHILAPKFQEGLTRLQPVEVYEKPFSLSNLCKVVREVLAS